MFDVKSNPVAVNGFLEIDNVELVVFILNRESELMLICPTIEKESKIKKSNDESRLKLIQKNSC